MSTVLDTEPVVLEELDLTPTCDWWGPTCDRLATWEATYSCGCIATFCNEHADEAEARMRLPFVRITCPECGASKIDRVEMRPL